LCDEDRYLLALVRYIHLNPIRAGVVETLEGLDHYPWSGHSALLGKGEDDWMDKDYVMSQFGTGKEGARKAYRKFVGEGLNMGRIPEFTGGGLFRSKGGWSQVVSARRRGEKEEFDERILGSGDFVNTILKEGDDKIRRQLKFRRAGIDLLKIIEEECTRGGISGNELRGGSRRRKVSEVRASVAKRGLDELGLSMAEVARHVGVNTSSIAKAVVRLERAGR
jgi:hypothetical protein